MTSKVRYLVLSATFLWVAACAGTQDEITGVQSTGTAAVLTDRAPSQVELCKIGPVGTYATFEITADGGNLPSGTTVTIQAQAPELFNGDLCPVVWRATEPAETPEVISNVTIAEVSMSAGTTFEKVFVGTATGSQFIAPVDEISLQVSFSSGALVKFYNVYTPTDEGGQGCTPGYWKASQHFDSWTAPYTPATAFGSVFADAFPGMSLLDVMNLGGGGLNALGRHSVAALLNAAGGSVSYGMTTDAVIEDFNAAFSTGQLEAQKNIFETSNEMGCPLS